MIMEMHSADAARSPILAGRKLITTVKKMALDRVAPITLIQELLIGTINFCSHIYRQSIAQDL